MDSAERRGAEIGDRTRSPALSESVRAGAGADVTAATMGSSRQPHALGTDRRGGRGSGLTAGEAGGVTAAYAWIMQTGPMEIFGARAVRHFKGGGFGPAPCHRSSAWLR